MMLWEAAQKILDAIEDAEEAGFKVKIKELPCQCCKGGVVIRDASGREVPLHVY